MGELIDSQPARFDTLIRNRFIVTDDTQNAGCSIFKGNGMNFYHESTDLFHVYANPPGIHGRVMVTVESERAAKQYLFELYGIPFESWEPRHYSEDGFRVDVWLCRDINETSLEYEKPRTYFTIERVLVMRFQSDQQAA